MVVMPAPATPAVGFDIGNVISGGRKRSGGPEDTIFGRRFLDTPQVPGAIAGVAWAVRRFGADRVFFISKVRTPAVRTKTLRWLDHVDFWRRTGATPEHVTFCAERADKAAVAARLGLQAFTDDKPDVLLAMPDVPMRLCFDPLDRDLDRARSALSGITVVRSWSDVVSELDRLAGPCATVRW